MIAATFYAYLSHVLGFALSRQFLVASLLVRTLVFWVGCATFLFVIVEPAYVLLASFFLAIVLAPKLSSEKACFYVLTMPALPTYLAYILSTFGIGYLISIDHYVVVGLALLVPILFHGATERRLPDFSLLPASLMLTYILYVALVSGLNFGATAGLRMLVEQSIVLLLPLVALTRVLAEPEDIDLFIRSLIGASVFLAALTLIISIKQWDFYKLNAPPLIAFSDFRGGFLRVEATANTHSLGFHLAFGFLLIECIKARHGEEFNHQLRRARIMALRGLLLFGLLMTDSRGALVALVLGYLIYSAVLIESHVYRRALYFAYTLAAIGLAVWMISGDFSHLGSRDSISYRQELMMTSLQYILANPIFGDAQFLTSGFFDHLLQGQGIIDITNLYLLVGLQYGFVGMFLFFGALLVPHIMLFRRRPRAWQLSTHSFHHLNRMRAVVLGSGCGWCFLVVTTSDVALTTHLGFMTAVLACSVSSAIVAAERRGVEENAGVEGSEEGMPSPVSA